MTHDPHPNVVLEKKEGDKIRKEERIIGHQILEHRKYIKKRIRYAQKRDLVYKRRIKSEKKKVNRIEDGDRVKHIRWRM